MYYYLVDMMGNVREEREGTPYTDEEKKKFEKLYGRELIMSESEGGIYHD